jgi:hypothetical protein
MVGRSADKPGAITSAFDLALIAEALPHQLPTSDKDADRDMARSMRRTGRTNR